MAESSISEGARRQEQPRPLFCACRCGDAIARVSLPGKKGVPRAVLEVCRTNCSLNWRYTVLSVVKTLPEPPTYYHGTNLPKD